MKMSKIIFVAVIFSVICTIDSRIVNKESHKILLRGSVENLLRHKREAEESSEDIAAKVAEAKVYWTRSWERNKLGVIGELIEALSDSDSTITVVGTQNIYAANGKIDKVRSINLVIPPKPESNEPNKDEDDDDDDWETDSDRTIPHDLVKKLRDGLAPFEGFGAPGSITLEQYNSDGHSEGVVYIDQDELFFISDGFAVYNKTVHYANPKEVEEAIRSVKDDPRKGQVGFLQYEHGRLVRSQLAPALQGQVLEDYAASDEMLIEAPAIISQVTAEHRQSEVPKELALAFNKAFPEYKWNTITNVTYSYVYRDVSLVLSYDNVDFYEDSSVDYFVYGNNITATSN